MTADGIEQRPMHPWRLKMFIYGCGKQAAEEEIDKARMIAGAGPTPKRRKKGR